ncbi:MAG TPA: putative glycoside hydrolase [Chloroflexota bacterium]|nr:putative glycoside hydrolase [Chloroflexota bacterium]
MVRLPVIRLPSVFLLSVLVVVLAGCTQTPGQEEGPQSVVTPRYDVGGIIVDTASGQPIPGAIVRFEQQEIIAGPDGRFELTELQSGTTVTLEAPGYVADSIEVLESGQVEVKLQPTVLSGTVVDKLTGDPVSRARLEVDGQDLLSDERGAFTAQRVRLGSIVAVQAPGYQRVEQPYTGEQDVNLSLAPRAISVRATDTSTGQTIDGIDVRAGNLPVEESSDGTVSVLRAEPGATIEVSAEGYAPATLTIADEDRAEVALRPNRVSGRVTDASTGQPISDVTVSSNGATTVTDQDGRYTLDELAEDPEVTFAGQAYRKTTVPVRAPTLDVELELGRDPDRVRSSYLTFYGVGSKEIFDNFLELADKTEINAVTIDVKGDRGWIAYKSNVPMVAEIGAQKEIMIEDPKKFVADLHARGIYVIARIVLFKDDQLARARPDLAVKDSARGGLWIDGEDLAWTDAFSEEVWDYNIALAKEAAEHGFDEIQWDYIRFPTDASAGTTMGNATFSKPNNTQAARVGAITGFLKKATSVLDPLGVYTSVDVFGYVSIFEDDMGIGQRIEDLAPLVDYISPMVYPSLYTSGLPNRERTEVLYRTNYPAHPYEIVHGSLKIAQERLDAMPDARAKLRPWLQYFHDYVIDHPYNDREIRLQKKAAYDLGIEGWLFWDPSNMFQKGGFDPAE